MSESEFLPLVIIFLSSILIPGIGATITFPYNGNESDLRNEAFDGFMSLLLGESFGAIIGILIFI